MSLVKEDSTLVKKAHLFIILVIASLALRLYRLQGNAYMEPKRGPQTKVLQISSPCSALGHNIYTMKPKTIYITKANYCSGNYHEKKYPNFNSSSNNKI